MDKLMTDRDGQPDGDGQGAVFPSDWLCRLYK
jgi:hypothetical protein